MLSATRDMRAAQREFRLGSRLCPSVVTRSGYKAGPSPQRTVPNGRTRLTLRDLSEIMLLRGFTVSHECVRQWEANYL